MARIRLIHWNQREGAAHVRMVRALGHRVSFQPLISGQTFKEIRAKPPDLFLICLDRLPSHGREVAGGIREFKSTREVPILFVGGIPDKVEKLRRTVRGARFCQWEDVGPAIRQALASPPPPMPDHRFAGYSGTPLPRKLGIRDGSRVALVSAPDDFAGTLGPLPAGARLGVRGTRDLTIWFVRSLQQLEAALPGMRKASEQGGVWIAWPKRTSAIAADVSETEVRARGLAAGMVDHKICAIDQTWSGLRFALRRR